MILEVRDLKKHFPIKNKILKAVDGVSFSLSQGETLSIVGESGSGKTTLAKALLGSTQDSQVLLGVLVIGRHPGDSQRVRDVLVVGQSSARVIAGTELRRLFNLPSTQFSLLQSDRSYIFSGRGYGHGLGLSQWGAKALADYGYNAEQILSYYYKDVTIEPLAQEGAI